MKLRSLKGKVFRSTGGTLGWGESFSYDPDTGRLYKRVSKDGGGWEDVPQGDYSKSPHVPSFVLAIYVLDKSYKPHPVVAAHRDACEALTRASWEVAIATDALRELAS